MMADIIVDTYKLNQYAQRLATVNARLYRLDGRLDSLYWQTGLQGMWNVMQNNILMSYSWRLARCQTYLEQTARDFETTENTLLNQDPTNFEPRVDISFNEWLQKNKGIGSAVHRILKTIKTEPIGFGVAESMLLLLPGDAMQAFWSKGLEYSDGAKSGSVKPSYGTYKDKKILGDKDHLNANFDQEKTAIYQKGKDEKWYKKKGTLLEAKAEQKVEGSVLEGNLSGGNDWAEGSIESKLLTAEAHAEASGGLYVYTKNKDGKTVKVFSPGVNAEVGASAAAFEVNTEGRIGLGEDKNMLGVYGDANAELLSGEAKIKIAANRNEVYAGASMEADLAKVSATGGVSVLGTDVGVTGSLKFGAGFHAEGGFTDGKLKVDVGVAVGLGFDLGFEVDVSGTVDAVTNVVSDAYNGISNAWGDVTEAAENVWDFIF